MILEFLAHVDADLCQIQGPLRAGADKNPVKQLGEKWTLSLSQFIGNANV